VHGEGCEKRDALSDCVKCRGRSDGGYDGIEDEEVGKKSCTHCFHSFRVVGSPRAQLLELKMSWENSMDTKLL